MKRLNYIFYIAVVSIFLTACQDDLLDKYPLDAVTEPVFFKTPNDLEIYVNQYYNRGNFPIMDKGRGDAGTDVYISEGWINQRFEGTRTINSAPALSYGNIRSVNYFFENLNKVERRSSKNISNTLVKHISSGRCFTSTC